MVDINVNTISVPEATTRLGELVNEVASRPVGITRKDQLAAYLVSKHDFESLVARIDELEDQLWVARAELARSKGFVQAADVAALVTDAKGICDEEAGDHEISL